MKKVFRSHLIVACFLSFMLSCTKDKGTFSNDTLIGCDSLNVTWTSKIQTIFLTNCTFSGCHDGSGAVGNFNNYNDVKLRVDNGKFKLRVFDLKGQPGSMPLYPGKLSACEYKKLEVWVNTGAP